MRVLWAVLVLSVLVFVSAVALVVVRHETRIAFMELQKLQQERDVLNVEWGRLQLEQSTWARPARIETLARERLRMSQPPLTAVVLVRP